MLLFLTIHQPVAYQNTVGRGSRRSLVVDFELQFVSNSSGTPASVVSAHFTDQRFDIRSNAARAGMRTARLIGQSVQAAAFGYLTDGRAVVDFSYSAQSDLDNDTRCNIGI